jgi:hypothetical protein
MVEMHSSRADLPRTSLSDKPSSCSRSGALFEDFSSSRWIPGQHANGEIEGLTGSLERMGPMCHGAPTLVIPAGDTAVMNPATRLAQCFGHAPRAGISDAGPDGHCLFRRDRFGRPHSLPPHL